MRNKILLFKLLAAIIAMGGAILSVSANSVLIPTSGYVHYTTASNAIIQQYCVKAVTCDRPGPFPCVVQITIAGVITNYNTKKAGCIGIQEDKDAAVDGTITLPPTARLII